MVDLRPRWVCFHISRNKPSRKSTHDNNIHRFCLLQSHQRKLERGRNTFFEKPVCYVFLFAHVWSGPKGKSAFNTHAHIAWQTNKSLTTIKPTSSVNCYGKISTDIVLNLSSLSNPLQHIKETLFYRVPPLGIQNYWLLLHELKVWAKWTCSFPKRKAKTLSFLFYYTSPFYLFKNRNCFGDKLLYLKFTIFSSYLLKIENV